VITGEATLSVIGTKRVEYGTPGGGPIFFSFDQLDGDRQIEGRGPPNCTWRTLESGQPISQPIEKSGTGFGPSARPSDFDRWFATDPEVHLPPGWWRITAAVQAWHATCPGPGDLSLHAAVVVRVSP
jgi:hypothetical protein